MRRAVPVLLTLATALLISGAPSASAATWNPVASNTTEDITAVEYQSPDRFWFTTGAGKIFRRVGGNFVQVASVPGTVFKDIEFQAGGPVGFAVGTNGTVRRSGDSGATWTTVALTGGRQTDVNDCSSASQPLGDAESIRFAGDARAYVVAGGSQIYRTVTGATAANVGSTAGGWQWINNSGGTCKINDDIDDLFPFPGSDSVSFISKDFGKVFFSSNALDTTATVKSGSAGNGFQQTRRVAGDPDNPNRQWSVQPYGGGGSYYARTTDGWSSDSNWTLGNPDRGDLTVGESVDFAGGTVLASGSAGEILESIDGVTFYLDPAAGTLATEDWKAVSLASGADGAIGGVGGKLVVSANANTIPDVVAPTGLIAGPTTVVLGQPATFTANLADEAGGSGVNPASVAFTATGTPGGTTNPVTLTFPSTGFYTVRATFRDNAGNQGEAALSVQVVAPVVVTPPKPLSKTVTTTASIAGGGSVSLGVPRACIPVGSTFKATLSFKRSTKKGAKAVKVTSVAFTVDGKKKTTDKKAPFVKTISVKALKAGSKHKLNARATIKVKKGKSPKKSISASFKVCG